MNGCHIKPEQFFNLIFGYYDRYLEYQEDLNPGAGTISKTLTAVPAGEVWVVQAAYCANAARAARMLIRVTDGTNLCYLVDTTPAVVGGEAIWTGGVTLKAGDYIAFLFVGTTAGDDLRWAAAGYKMKIA